jgi:hypothetical protein
MTTWPKDELRRISEADDLHISPFREDGRTYGTPTWIWPVVVDDALYVRAYNGQNSRWYQATAAPQREFKAIRRPDQKVILKQSACALQSSADSGLAQQ